MLQCLFQPRSTWHTPTWLHFLSSSISGSRGIKLSALTAKAAIKPGTTSGSPGAGPGHRSGSYYLSRLREANIGTWHELLTLKMDGKKENEVKIYVRSAKRHCRKMNDDKHFADQGTADAEVVMHRYLRDHSERPLWVTFAALSAHRPIVKGKFRVRVIAAWRQALRNAGWDPSGRRLVGDRKSWGGPKELFGTVEIVTQDPLAIQDVPFAKVRAYFQEVVKKLEVRLGWCSKSTWETKTQQRAQKMQNGAPTNDRHDGRRGETAGETAGETQSPP